eukprot:766218-Hanusia_phi.AAC.1
MSTPDTDWNLARPLHPSTVPDDVVPATAVLLPDDKTVRVSDRGEGRRQGPGHSPRAQLHHSQNGTGAPIQGVQHGVIHRDGHPAHVWSVDVAQHIDICTQIPGAVVGQWAMRWQRKVAQGKLQHRNALHSPWTKRGVPGRACLARGSRRGRLELSRHAFRAGGLPRQDLLFTRPAEHANPTRLDLVHGAWVASGSFLDVALSAGARGGIQRRHQ